MRAVLTPLDFLDNRDNVRLREVRVYAYSSLLNPAASFFINSPILSGTPLADWRAGDFSKAGFLAKVDQKGKLDYSIELEFEDKSYDKESLLFLRKMAKRNLLIQFTDDCNIVSTVGPMRMGEGSGDSNEFLNIAGFALRFTRATPKIQTSEVLNDAIVAVLVSCSVQFESPALPDPSASPVFPQNIRVVTIVECSI